MISVSSDHWTAYLMPDSGKGATNGKHITGAWCPVDGRNYMTGGDYVSPEGGGGSYEQYTWSLDLAERVAGGANAGWRVIHPYCLPSTRVEMPKHPDTVGFVWVKDRFWMVPGKCVTSSTNCPGETSNAVSDPGYRFNEMMTLDISLTPGTWTSVTHKAVPGAAGSRHCVYDALSNSLYRWRWDGGTGMHVEAMKLTEPDVWRSKLSNLKNAGGGDVHCAFEYVAYDPVGRAMYSVDGSLGGLGYRPRLMRYRIGANAFDDLGAIPGPAYPLDAGGEWSHTIWLRPHGVLFFLRIPDPLAAYTYDPITRVWTTVPIVTDRTWNSGKLYGLNLAYDEGQDAVIVHGGVSPYFFLWRYPGAAPITRPVIGQITRLP